MHPHLPSIPSAVAPHHGKTRLVYLPGIDGTGRLLHRQQRLFDDYDVRCIAYPQTTPNTYEQLVELAEEQLGTGGIVLTESFGGAVAMMLALKRPDLVQELVIVNSFAYYPRRPLIRLLSILGKLLPMRPSSVWTRGMRGILFFPPDTSKEEQDAWWDLTADVPMWAYGMRVTLLANMDLRSRLAEIRCPTTVFVAPNDRIVPPPAGRILAQRIPNARLIEMPLGHAAMIHPAINVAQWLHESRGTNEQIRLATDTHQKTIP